MVEGGSEEVKQQVKRYITKYICDYRITVKGKTHEQLIDDLYTEMAEFSFLTKYIFGTGIEEIDINSWRDIEIQYNDGRCEKLEEHFESPEHAVGHGVGQCLPCGVRAFEQKYPNRRVKDAARG